MVSVFKNLTPMFSSITILSPGTVANPSKQLSSEPQARKNTFVVAGQLYGASAPAATAVSRRWCRHRSGTPIPSLPLNTTPFPNPTACSNDTADFDPPPTAAAGATAHAVQGGAAPAAADTAGSTLWETAKKVLKYVEYFPLHKLIEDTND